MRRIPLPALVAFLALFAGCQDSIWRTYRDDPYLADLAGHDEADVLRSVSSTDRNERIIALRLIAHRAGEARRLGQVADADRLEEVILRRYQLERDTMVRASVVRICAPVTGRGSARMVAFLRERIAAGEFPGYAALSLASLAPKNAFEDIEPLTRHPAPEVRLQVAVALTVLGDPRGFEPVARIWRGMREPAWPERIEEMSLAEARNALEQRARRAFGRPLY